MPKRQKQGDWVVVGGAVGETAHCTRCGRGLEMGVPQPMPIAIAMMKAFVALHKNCKSGWQEPTPRTPQEWASSRDTGTSSFTIWSAMTGKPSPHGRYDIPYDPQDFGRCYRLLKLFPEWRPALDLVAAKYPDWEPFVANWDVLTALYETALNLGEDSAGDMYNFMQSLRGVHA